MGGGKESSASLLSHLEAIEIELSVGEEQCLPSVDRAEVITIEDRPNLLVGIRSGLLQYRARIGSGLV